MKRYAATAADGQELVIDLFFRGYSNPDNSAIATTRTVKL